MKSFFETFPFQPRWSPRNASQLLYHVTVCPEEGKLGRDFKPVAVEPWQPEPRRVRRAKRPVTAERVEELNAQLEWEVPAPWHVRGLREEEGLPIDPEGLDFESRPALPFEFEDPRYFEPAEAGGIRSLVQPRMSSADYSWRAPAARCRSCGCETWVASIADGIRMISNPRHRKGCGMPPNRLEVESSCAA